jgi:hypothetical protein
VKKRWKVLIGLATIAALFVALPVGYIELGCRGGGDTVATMPYRPLGPAERAEARSWLTYPEWHIVYAADSLGAWLAAGKRPSGYPYVADARNFWTSYCRLNRQVSGRDGSGDARLMLHVIGLSFTAEMLVKSVYENTIGRLSEAIGGWASPEDRYAARVQQSYGAFMHETPWYRFGFGPALSGAWRVPGSGFRYWERRLALSSEYGVKAGYAKAIGGANSATLGPDETRMHMVIGAHPAQVAGLDPRLVPLRPIGTGAALVDTPRYATFTDIALRLADRTVKIIEIAGNDDIFVTALMPNAGPPKFAGVRSVMTMTLPDGRVRQGLAVKVPDLIPLLNAVRIQGGTVEHVYDY